MPLLFFTITHGKNVEGGGRQNPSSLASDRFLQFVLFYFFIIIINKKKEEEKTRGYGRKEILFLFSGIFLYFLKRFRNLLLLLLFSFIGLNR